MKQKFVPFGTRYISEAAASLVAGLASAAAATGSTVSVAKANKRGAKLARELNDKNIQYQKEANDLNYKRALDMWNMENEYNTPSAQMQRYVDAGLNPNLIYQQENTASDIGAPDVVAPQSDLSESEIVSNGGLRSMAEIGRVADELYNRYHQEKVDASRLSLNEVQKQLAEYNLSHQKDISEFEKRKAIADARVSEARADDLDWRNTLEYRETTLADIRARIDQQKLNIEMSNHNIEEKRKRLARLDEDLEMQAKIQAVALVNARMDVALKKYSVEQQAQILRDVRYNQAIQDAVSEKLHNVDAPGWLSTTTEFAVSKVLKFIDKHF